MKIKLNLNWNKVFIGVYLKKKEKFRKKQGEFMPYIEKTFHIWICVVPCLPIHVWWDIK